MSASMSDTEGVDMEKDFVDIDSDDDKSNGIDLFDVVIANPTPADKRAHHNALERKRRDHIKESFCKLRDCVPNLTSEKASRAQILKKATDYIASMKNKNSKYQVDIDSMRQQNKRLEDEVAALEKIKHTNMFAQNKPTKDMDAREKVESEQSGSNANDNDNSPDSKTRRKKQKIT